MNILLITQLFPADEAAEFTSGALRDFVLEWEKEGHEIQVIRPHFSYEKELFANTPFSIGNDIRVEFIRPSRIPFIKWTYYNTGKLIRRLVIKPDIVICHLYNSYFTFGRLAKKLGVPFVVGIHMSDIKIAKNWFHRLHQRMVFSRVDAFACRSFAYEQQFQEIFPAFAQKTFVVESGIPSQYLVEKEFANQSNVHRIITVSRLIKRKQVDKVITALSRIPATIDWTYTIVGDGAEKENLMKLVEEYSLQGRVNFTGTLSREEVMFELRRSDFFVLPSYQETFGLVYLEAMAASCITIGSVGEGIDGVIRDGENGFLCHANNTGSIYDKIEQALLMDAESKTTMQKKIAETIKEYTCEIKAIQYLNHLKKLTNDYCSTPQRVR